MILQPTKVFVRVFFLCLPSFVLITLYILGEWKVLKTEVVPSLSLPEKSTFKIKISKKDNSKEVKVEEVKVKEEKEERKVYFRNFNPFNTRKVSVQFPLAEVYSSPPPKNRRHFRDSLN